MGTTTAGSARSIQYYVITKRWASDLEFFQIETSFLYDLIVDYFMRLCEPAYIEKFKRLTKSLTRLEIDKKYADRVLAEQLKHLEQMAEDIIPEDIDSLSEKQIQLEYLITDLINEYRDVKSELFTLVSNIRRIKAS